MLSHPTIDRLRELGLVGMVHALEEQRRQPDSADLSFEDRLAMLVDREETVQNLGVVTPLAETDDGPTALPGHDPC